MILKQNALSDDLNYLLKILPFSHLQGHTVTYNHQHLSLLLIHAASRKTDRRPSSTAIKASLSVASDELLTLLLSRLFASVCLLLSVSVLKFRSECAACIPRVPRKHNLHGQLRDLFTLVRMSLFACVCASYGLPSLVK